VVSEQLKKCHTPNKGTLPRRFAARNIRTLSLAH
jgi:hypothetical protein